MNETEKQPGTYLSTKDILAKCEDLVVHSAKYKTILTEKYKKRKKYTPRNFKHEISYIPGTMLKIFVKDGDAVKKGEPLLILEAMKMENTIYAPFDGEILKIHVKEGEVLPKGSLMLEYA